MSRSIIEVLSRGMLRNPSDMTARVTTPLGLFLEQVLCEGDALQ